MDVNVVRSTAKALTTLLLQRQSSETPAYSAIRRAAIDWLVVVLHYGNITLMFHKYLWDFLNYVLILKIKDQEGETFFDSSKGFA